MGWLLAEINVSDTVAGQAGEIDLGDGLAAFPGRPDDQPLAIGGDAGDKFPAAADAAQAAVGALILREQRVIEPHAIDGSVFAGQQQAAAPEPRKRSRRADARPAPGEAGELS